MAIYTKNAVMSSDTAAAIQAVTGMQPSTHITTGGLYSTQMHGRQVVTRVLDG